MVACGNMSTMKQKAGLILETVRNCSENMTANSCMWHVMFLNHEWGLAVARVASVITSKDGRKVKDAWEHH